MSQDLPEPKPKKKKTKKTQNAKKNAKKVSTKNEMIHKLGRTRGNQRLLG